MILWLNGAFGAGKTTVAYELHRRLPNSFVYDPENIGYFIRKNAPESIQKDDFQDHALWRQFNYDMLSMLAEEHEGVIIAPMTLVDPVYFSEIVERLRRDGTQLCHITLAAKRETLLKRLKKRGDFSQSWPAKQVDRCVNQLSEQMFGWHLQTDELGVEQILDRIADHADLKLLPDQRSATKKSWDRFVTKLRHIRF
ncbi:AAA family ATPase [Paenibacillus sp. HB172176]|uniref:AAA family ATPase n=1 Tax=Paenibacillus sp. HB172176 TaxID=2493690 RepID=UPI00143A7E38|nr:AAA family ATPase [Paenibacillus sp. HB172176]